MSGLALFAVTLLILLGIFAFLALLKRPVYQLTEENVVRLLELVIERQASEDDWNVFVDMPIRYNDELETIRRRCIEIFEQDTEPKQGNLFSEAGLCEIKELLIGMRVEQE